MALFCNAGWPARHWAERAGVFHLTLRLFFSVRSDDIRNTRSGLLELGSFFLFLRAPRVTLLATVQPGLLCAQTNLDARATCTPTSGSSLTNRLPPKTDSTFSLVRLRQDPLASDKTNKNATLSRFCPSIALPQTTTRNLALCNKNQHQLAMQSAICPARRPERAAPRTTLITALIDAPCSASMKSQDQIRSLPASSILLRRLVNNYICIDLGTWNSIFGRRRRISQRRT